ncbi:MAG: hypothetical protein JWN65_2344, partial [Solirubrobacterales bacterium]|nr:hypothetical protein [Solirubrobacterales bacterium]
MSVMLPTASDTRSPTTGTVPTTSCTDWTIGGRGLWGGAPGVVAGVDAGPGAGVVPGRVGGVVVDDVAGGRPAPG